MSEPKIAVQSLKLKVGEVVIDLSLEDAKALRDALDKALPSQSSVPWAPIEYHHHHYRPAYREWPVAVPLWGSSGGVYSLMASCGNTANPDVQIGETCVTDLSPRLGE